MQEDVAAFRGFLSPTKTKAVDPFKDLASPPPSSSKSMTDAFRDLETIKP
jgi:hypothetical protein